MLTTELVLQEVLEGGVVDLLSVGIALGVGVFVTQTG